MISCWRNQKRHQRKRGQALIISVVFLVAVSGVVLSGVATPLVSSIKNTRRALTGLQSYLAAESGAEDVAYRLKAGLTVDNSETLSYGGGTVTTVSTDVAGNKEIIASGDLGSLIRKVKTVLAVASGASFNVGMQVGAGGFTVDSNVNLHGNLYSNGPVTSSSNFEIFGDAVSAGPSGLLNDADVTGNAYAHTISNSDIDGDAHYVTKTNTSVDGTSYPNSPDQPIIPLPIAEETIDGWEAQAEAGGVTNCSGTLTWSGNLTIGPRKYTCNVRVNTNTNLTLGGPVWIVGDFTNNSNLDIIISPAQSGKTIPIIVDNPSNRTTSSKIDNNSNLDVFGAGQNSYVMFISRNNSGELGGSTYAIENDSNMNNSGPIIMYAGHGTIRIDSNTDINQLTAYKLDVNSNLDLFYELGLANLVFTSGPGGAWAVQDWLETQ